MLLFYYGDECPHCHVMMPLVERLEKEQNVRVERLESWHDEGNARKLAEHDPNGERCGGVPFFFNTESQQYLCGEADYDRLVAWATGEPLEEQKKTPRWTE